MDDEGPEVAELVVAAMRGDGAAWDEIVQRYTPLLMSVLRGFRLPEADVRDIVQTVWLRLVEHLGGLREPRALPGWLVTTTRNEAIKTLKARSRSMPLDVFEGRDANDGVSIDEDLLRVERREALLEAFAELGHRDRELLVLLTADPAVPYAEISRRVGIPIGSIGPTRARALSKLRACPSLVALSDATVIVTERN